MQADEQRVTANRRNYQKELDAYLTSLTNAPRKTLLLQCCCAPCASYVLEYLSPYFNILLYMYNPNIFPPAEYQKRLAELERLITVMPLKNPVTLIPAPYHPEDYAMAAAGLGLEPEGGARCTACFRLRLNAAAEQAAEAGADAFATTLTVSPHKDAPRINSIGEEAAASYGVPYLCSDFKKRGGYQRSIVLSREYGLYRQNYCGCMYSLPEETEA
ncbi:MAG: epoxyqueuosine reductase QueH [Eubacteriales bacterium]|nr:epoxyqueuosine reductase QueH [Eubacteriales bacterium]